MFCSSLCYYRCSGAKRTKGSNLNKNKILELDVVLLPVAIQERDGGVRERVS